MVVYVLKRHEKKVEEMFVSTFLGIRNPPSNFVKICLMHRIHTTRYKHTQSHHTQACIHTHARANTHKYVYLCFFLLFVCLCVSVYDCQVTEYKWIIPSS